MLAHGKCISSQTVLASSLVPTVKIECEAVQSVPKITFENQLSVNLQRYGLSHYRNYIFSIFFNKKNVWNKMHKRQTYISNNKI